MEFHEKLQRLRKHHGLTQEQLAEKLYVSRTAVSKWESGRGYPSIDSLKCISGVFGVSIDELLSSEELIDAVGADGRAGPGKSRASTAGIIDLATALLILLPLYGNPVDGRIQSANLISFTAAAPLIRAAYWFFLALLTAAGAVRIVLARSGREMLSSLADRASLLLSITAILFFAAVREPYVLSLLFILFLAKLFLQLRNRQNQPKMR